VIGNPVMSTSFRTNLAHGFTLIELIIVMAIVSLLLTLAAPRYFKSVDRSKETVLKANLAGTRDALDKFFADTGRYPERLAELVDRKYLRAMPWDPIAESAEDWTVVAPKGGQPGSVYNIFSSAPGVGSNNVPYADW
jgi:general secretion pathway protein G